MSSLLKGGTVLLVSACFATPGFAQTTARAEAITAPVKNAGIFRQATGTWDRTPGSALAIGADVLFNHNAPTGYYHGQNTNRDQTSVGRVPSNDVGSEGYAATYDITCWQVAYCTDNVVGPDVTVTVRYYEQYNSCFDPAIDGGPGAVPAFQAGCNSATGLPGTTAIGTQSCWIVTVDMTGTNDVFNLKGDGDSVYDNISMNEELDDFGWTLKMSTTSGAALPSATGFILAGDPLNAAHGDGLDSQFTGPWVPAPADGTGLHERDQFYITDTTNSAVNGCYWFGGYPTNTIWGGHWHQVLGEANDGVPGSNYCTSTVNSTGCASRISASGTGSLSANGGNGDLVLTANNLPSQPGIFIAGPNQNNMPLYCSVLCIGFTGLQRFSSTAAPSGGRIIEAVNWNTSAPGGLNAMSGMTFNFQRWNRDPAGAGAGCLGPGTPNDTATFSDAIGVPILP